MGRAIAFIMAGRVVGADPSELMVEIAARRNRLLIEAARVDVVLAGVESLPFADDFFDKVLCVHVVYFWMDIDVSLREIVRVLRPGDRLALCSGPRLTRRLSRHFRRRSIASRSWPK